jgi:hypothetical protein
MRLASTTCAQGKGRSQWGAGRAIGPGAIPPLIGELRTSPSVSSLLSFSAGWQKGSAS